MLIPIIIAVVVVLTIVLIIIFKKKPTPPVPSPSVPSPSAPTPSPTPSPQPYTTVYVYNADYNSQDINLIRVDGVLVTGGILPLEPGNSDSYITLERGPDLDIEIRFSGLPAGTESLSIETGTYKDCVNGPAPMHVFGNVPVNETKINIDYDEVGC